MLTKENPRKKSCNANSLTRRTPGRAAESNEAKVLVDTRRSRPLERLLPVLSRRAAYVILAQTLIRDEYERRSEPELSTRSDAMSAFADESWTDL